ncbi:MAG: hypothetical protein AAFX06_26725 [Planctomycetota bacterium]
MKRGSWFGLVLIAGLFSAGLVADSTVLADDVLLVVGAPGDEEYGREFERWKERWKTIAKVADFDLSIVGPGGDTRNGDDRDALEAEITKRLDGGDPLWLLFVGHGTWDGVSARFNLVGPDVSARDLAKWLRPAKRPLVLVNCSSSSGPFVDRLSGPGRVVVTATKSGSEQNFARFGGYFAEAIANPDSDLDHDDAVSVREAFLKAASATGVFYQQEGRIATEHAMIDDNGDKKGTRVELLRGKKTLKGEGKIDGDLAGRITIPVNPDAPKLTKEQKAERDQLETQLRKLGRQGLSVDALRQQALPILKQLAELYRQAEAASK